MENSSYEMKSSRLLSLYARFSQRETIVKKEAAQEFGVTERSVQRDIEVLRCFFAQQCPPRELGYDAAVKGYRLTEQAGGLLSNSEILAVCKILLESRSMVQSEMFPILDKLLSCAVPQREQKAVAALISNEKFHYIAPHHGADILPGLWEIGQAIRTQQVLEITYERLKEPVLVTRKIQPVGILFSEYYFYLTAFLQEIDRVKSFENKDDLFPTIYRIDRIRDFKVLPEHFQVPYKDRFEEGEFRKRVQFMYGGKLEQIRFKYTGPSIEAVLDRLPTAEIVGRDEDGWEIKAEVFGKGIEMWLRSQGENVKVL